MIIHNVQQNSEEWDLLRIGKFTASSCDTLLSCKTTKGYKQLIDKIAEERFTGEKCESKVWKGNSFTERGHEYEPIAISHYESESFNIVEPVGFVEMNSWIGCSPDGFIDDDKMIQIKCPIFNTQREYHEKMVVPGSYYKQMQFEIMVTGRDINIFYSYHPYLKPVEIVVEKDDELIEEIQERIYAAKSEIEFLLEKFNNLRI